MGKGKKQGSNGNSDVRREKPRALVRIVKGGKKVGQYVGGRAKSSAGPIASALAGAVVGSVAQELAIDKLHVKPMTAAVVATGTGAAGAFLAPEKYVKGRWFATGVMASGAAMGYASWRQDEAAKKKKASDDDGGDDSGSDDGGSGSDDHSARQADLSGADDVMARRALDAARAEYEAAQTAAPQPVAQQPAAPQYPPHRDPAYRDLPPHLRPVGDHPTGG